MKKIALFAVLVLILLAIVSMSSLAQSYTYTYCFMTYDNGYGGIWATDHICRTITITENFVAGEDCYLYDAMDSGTAISFAGTSPSGADTVGDGVVAVISGYLSGSICGNFNPNVPSYEEDLTGTYDSYEDRYFHVFFDLGSMHGFDFDTWGWSYTTCGNGTWIDSDSGTSGDITGEPAACQFASPVPEPICTPAGAFVQPVTSLTEGLVWFTWEFNGYPVTDENGQVIETPPVYWDVEDESGQVVYGQAIGILILGCLEDLNSESLLSGMRVYINGSTELNWGWFAVGDAVEFREP